MSRIAVIGAGAFGTALAIAFARGGAQVLLVARDDAAAQQLEEHRENRRRLPGARLPETVAIAAGPDARPDGSIAVLAVPAQANASFAAAHRAALSGGPVVLAAKGIDLASGKLLSEVVGQALPGTPLAVLSGPGFADEIAADLVKIVADREPVIPPPWRPATDVDLALVDLTGPWYWGARPVALRLLGDGTLQLTPIGVANRGTQFRRTADDRWLGFKGFYADETLRVCRDAAGAVSHLDLGTLVLTRGPYQPATAVPGGVDPAGWRAGSGQPTTGTGRSVNGSAG